MGVEGMWTMTEDGEFALDETFAKKLSQARLAATYGWTNGLIEYLAGETPYTPEELKEALLLRNERDGGGSDSVEGFILEALGGDL